MKNLKDTIEYKELGFNIVICPVCSKETLDNYYICDNCKWEYDGITEDNIYSSANGCTISEYKQQFIK